MSPLTDPLLMSKILKKLNKKSIKALRETSKKIKEVVNADKTTMNRLTRRGKNYNLMISRVVATPLNTGKRHTRNARKLKGGMYSAISGAYVNRKRGQTIPFGYVNKFMTIRRVKSMPKEIVSRGNRSIVFINDRTGSPYTYGTNQKLNFGATSISGVRKSNIFTRAELKRLKQMI
jgi:hypothetical protein